MPTQNFLAPPLLKSLELTSAFNCVYNGQSATCFLYGEHGKTYFVTAKHAVGSAQVGDNVLFRKADGSFWPMPILSIVHSLEQDVSVFSSSGLMFPSDFGISEPSQLFPGQQALFVGFPHGLVTNYPNENGFASPLVRSASFSGIVQIAEKPTFVLDGFNNPGYSGAPVWANNHEGNPAVAAVVVQYRFEAESHSQIYTKKNGVPEIVPHLYARLNSGMIYAVGMDTVRSIAEQLNAFNDVFDNANADNSANAESRRA